MDSNNPSSFIVAYRFGKRNLYTLVVAYSFGRWNLYASIWYDFISVLIESNFLENSLLGAALAPAPFVGGGEERKTPTISFLQNCSPARSRHSSPFTPLPLSLPLPCSYRRT